MTGVTVYAFARLPLRGGRLPGRGASGERLQLLAEGRVAAIYGETSAPAAPEPEQLRAHDSVIRRLHEKLDGVIPARFGSHQPRSALLAILETREEAFREALAAVRGAEQMVLRVFSTGAPAPAADTPPAPKQSANLGPGAMYLQSRFTEHLASRTLPELAPLQAALSHIVRAERVRRVDSDEGLLGTVYHLVPRGRLERYQRAVAAAELPVRVVVRGPFAPYAFGPELGA